MMAFGCIFGLLLLAGPVILLLGLLGQRNPALPRCRACRAPLTSTAAIPSKCPGCGVPLTGARAVAFGGWRPYWVRVGIGGVLVLLTAGFFGFVTMRASGGPMRVVNNVVIERSVSTARFDERTATLDPLALEWVRAHLTHGELRPELARRAASILIAEIASGRVEGLRSNVEALAQAPTSFDRADLATAVFTATIDRSDRTTSSDADVSSDSAPSRAPAPATAAGASPPAAEASTTGLTARAVVGHDSIDIIIGPPNPVHYMSSLPIAIGVAIVDVRIDGVRLEAAQPRGRAGWLTGTLNGVFADPNGRAANAERIEVDLIVAAFAEEPPGFDRGLPGPPEGWPQSLVERRVTLEAVRIRR